MSAGVDDAEAAAHLEVLDARVDTGRTGAARQRAALSAAESERGRPAALLEVLRGYQRHSAAGEPVHTWSSPR